MSFQVPAIFDAYGEFLRAQAIVDRLNVINPKSPLSLELVSWDVDENNVLDPTKQVYVDITGESQARLMHLTRLLQADFAPAEALDRMLRLEYTPPLTLEAAVVAEDDVISQHLLSSWFSTVLTQPASDELLESVSTQIESEDS